MTTKLSKKDNTINYNNWRDITLLSVPSKIFSIVLLKWLLDAVNAQAWKQQGRLHCGCLWSKHFLTLCNITKQSIIFQWPLPVNINFLKKSFWKCAQRVIMRQGNKRLSTPTVVWKVLMAWHTSSPLIVNSVFTISAPSGYRVPYEESHELDWI